MRRFLCLLTLIFPITILSAQNSSVEADFFPLVLVLEAAEYAADAAGTWRPDWPVELPPDAFTVHAGEISRIRLVGEEITLSFHFDPSGSLAEFPFMLNGKMTQITLDYRDEVIRELKLTFPPAEESWKLEFLQYMNSFPSLVRASLGETWYFIYLSRGVNEITETWYDVEGNALWVYYFSLVEIGKNQRIRAIRNYSGLDIDPDTESYYDSRGLLTENISSGGTFRVLYYREALPRYWERWPAEGNADGVGKFTLQWDASGFLVRLTGEAGESESGGFIDFRYEYTLDEMGNWIERRETRMIRQFGLLVPSSGTIVKRILEYR